MKKIFRPTFIEPDNMKLLGFGVFNDLGNTLVYYNNSTVQYNKDYNTSFPEPKGKVILHINCQYSNSDEFYLNIKQDSGTRTVFVGICRTEQFLLELLNNIR